MSERVHVAGEVRAEGRTITGTVLTYGEVSPSHRERFLPGSLERDGDTWLDLDHDPTRVIAWEGAGLEFADTAEALTMRAELPRIPAASIALADIRSGKRRGLSVEFDALEERREPQTGIRELVRARLAGVGLVEAPSYPSAGVREVRRVSKRIVNGKVVYGSMLACRCRKNCDRIQFDPGAFDDALAEVAEGRRVVTAFLSGAFDRPLATTATDTLKLRVADGALRAEIDGLPDTGPARDFLAGMDAGTAEYILRVYFRDDESEVEVRDRVAYVERAALRGIEIAPLSGPPDGLEPVTLALRRRERGRRVWL